MILQKQNFHIIEQLIFTHVCICLMNFFFKLWNILHVSNHYNFFWDGSYQVSQKSLWVICAFLNAFLYYGFFFKKSLSPSISNNILIYFFLPDEIKQEEELMLRKKKQPSTSFTNGNGYHSNGNKNHKSKFDFASKKGNY